MSAFHVIIGCMKRIIITLIGMLVSQAIAETKLVTVTAYCKCKTCCGKWAKYGNTASGVKPKQGVTIAATRSIPFGTKVQIAGVGLRTVQDRLAYRYDDRIDLYFDSHMEALKFGIKRLSVTF